MRYSPFENFYFITILSQQALLVKRFPQSHGAIPLSVERASRKNRNLRCVERNIFRAEVLFFAILSHYEIKVNISPRDIYNNIKNERGSYAIEGTAGG